MTWCVAKSERAPNWTNVFAIFDVMLWIYAILSIFICGFVLHIFMILGHDRRKENFAWACITALCFSIGIYGHYDPRKLFIRLYMMTLLFYGMHFSAAYHSFLLSVLTRPRFETQVATVELAIQSEYHFTGS